MSGYHTPFILVAVAAGVSMTSRRRRNTNGREGDTRKAWIPACQINNKSKGRKKVTDLEISELLFEFKSCVAIENQLGSKFIGELPQLLHDAVVNSHLMQMQVKRDERLAWI